MLASKGTKPQKGQASTRARETLITRFEGTHTSIIHEDNVGEDEEDLPPKGKRAESENAEAGMQPKGSKRPRRTSARTAGKSSERIKLSDESEDDPLALVRKKPAPQGYVIAFMFQHFRKIRLAIVIL